MPLRTTHLLLCFALFFGAEASLIHAAQPFAIGINIQGTDNSTTPATPIAPMTASESAGVFPQTNWNNIAGDETLNTQTTPQALADNTGAATTATVVWDSDHTSSNTG